MNRLFFNIFFQLHPSWNWIKHRACQSTAVTLMLQFCFSIQVIAETTAFVFPYSSCHLIYKVGVSVRVTQLTHHFITYLFYLFILFNNVINIPFICNHLPHSLNPSKSLDLISAHSQSVTHLSLQQESMLSSSRPQYWISCRKESAQS